MATDWRQDLVNNREQTLRKIYAQVYPMVLHYVQKHSGTPNDAKDLVQEAIILFYEKVVQEKFVLTASATTYLMAVCKNYWRRELNKRSRLQELTPELNEKIAEEAATTPEKPAYALRHFVAQLGEKCQDILTAFYYNGQRLEQIAIHYHYRNVRSATVQKFKCLERLRKSLASFTLHHFK
jgi:RNA polymerase sigma factor (sigma-70 family)